MLYLLLLGFLVAKGLNAQVGAGAAAAPCAGSDKVTRIALNDSGIASWNVLNPRRPHPILHVRDGFGAVAPASPECFASVFSASESWQGVEVSFINETSDRLFEVRIPFKLPALDFGPGGNVCTWTANAIRDQAGSQPIYCVLLASLIKEPSNQQKFSDNFKSLCQKAANGYQCTYTLTVSQGGPSILNPVLLRYLWDPQTDSSGLLTFNVFFVGDGGFPSQNAGYLQVRASSDEPRTAWPFTG